jgi:hypothetical protein
MIEAVGTAAWETDKGAVIVSAVVTALSSAGIMPMPATIERAGVAGRARARKRAHEALLIGLYPERARPRD